MVEDGFGFAEASNADAVDVPLAVGVFGYVGAKCAQDFSRVDNVFGFQQAFDDCLANRERAKN